MTLNTNLLTLDMSGTTVNAILPTGSKVSTLELGTPTSISLLSPTQLQPSGIIVDNSSSLTNLVITNMPNVKTFNTLAKILNI